MNLKPLFISSILLATLSVSANASELTFKFMNPSFGGNPLNGSHLLNTANAQNKHRAPDLGIDEEQLASEALIDALKSRIISQSFSDIAEGVYAAGETVQVGDYYVEIVEGTQAGLLDLNIYSKSSGALISTVTMGSY